MLELLLLLVEHDQVHRVVQDRLSDLEIELGRDEGLEAPVRRAGIFILPRF